MEYLQLLDTVNKFEQEGNTFASEIRIAFLRNFTIENVLPYLKYYFYSEGISPKVSFGEYNNMTQEVLNTSSHVYNGNQLIVLSVTLDEIAGSGGLFALNAEQAWDEIKFILDGVLNNTNSLIACGNFLEPFYNEKGIAYTGGTLTEKINFLNRKFEDYRQMFAGRFFILDVNRLVKIAGEENAIDYRFWYSSKALYKHSLLNLYAKEISKIGKALLGKNKKCLVLDCDNTLWKGVIGEDGMNGIKLDPNSYPGNIFYAFQQTVLQLHERGVIVALCSKNNEEDVFEVLDKHSSCLIRKSHLASWKINWNNKADNIRELAEELNIGLDYFVFVDDSSMECNLVKEQLPAVEVIQVPQKLYLYPDILLRDGIFDTLVLSDEDKKRNDLYRVETERRESKKHFSDITEYLRSLNIVLKIGHNDKKVLSRLSQLTQKTNQFNLTTIRYSEAELSAMVESGSSDLFHFSVEDKFGDMGITGLIILKQSQGSVMIENFLLSCRILGRNIELAFVDHCLKLISKTISPEKIFSSFIPSKKNSQTKDFWFKCGFEKLSESDQKTEFVLEMKKYEPKVYDYIKIENI